MNPKEEKEKLKIDVPYRKKKFEKLFTDFNEMFVNISDYYFSTPSFFKEEFNLKKNTVQKNKMIRKNRKQNAKPKMVNVIKRNIKISENALENAGYLCENDPLHKTFIKRKKHVRYMEAHHLIPLEAQHLFEFSLDVEANIICLCSSCHNEIHYGENYKELIKKFYEERKDWLKECGIVIDLNFLYSIYEKVYTKDDVILEENIYN